MKGSSKFFSVMVVGDNPDDLMKKYDINLKVEPYIKYKYADAKKIRTNSLKILEEIIKNKKELSLNDFQTDYFKTRMKVISSMSHFEYYQLITEGLYYDDDGNALSEENPNGKWEKYQIGNHFSLPLKLKNGKEAYQSINEEINWDAMNMQNTETYEIVWDLVHGNREPHSEEEENIYNNMKDKKQYFSNFKDKEAYVLYNCSYWNYAYLDENGWFDVDDNGNEMEWITNFFQKYVQNLNSTDKITIYECSKRSD